VADADVISTFWSGTTCHTLVYELDRDQPKNTKELLDITTRHACHSTRLWQGGGWGRLHPGQHENNRQWKPSSTIQSHHQERLERHQGWQEGAEEAPRCIVVAVSNNGDDEKADDSSKECVAAAERDFKRQTQQSKDHFEKLLKATCPNHSCLIKHKLKDCTMMKNFITSGAFSRGRKLERDPGGKSVTPIPDSLQWGTQARTCQAKWDTHPTQILAMLRIAKTNLRM
jgi:hypothetical protein